MSWNSNTNILDELEREGSFSWSYTRSQFRWRRAVGFVYNGNNADEVRRDVLASILLPSVLKRLRIVDVGTTKERFIWSGTDGITRDVPRGEWVLVVMTRKYNGKLELTMVSTGMYGCNRYDLRGAFLYLNSKTGPSGININHFIDDPSKPAPTGWSL